MLPFILKCSHFVHKNLHLYTPTAGTLPIAERIHLWLPSPLPVRTPILQIEKYLTLQSPSPSGKSKTVEHLACSSIPDPRHCAPSEMVSMAAAAAAVGVLLPFPFYYALWTHPQRWVDLCGRGADPCRRMAQVSHALKALQLLALASVASFSWPPPLYCPVLLAVGQYLNFK